MADKSLRVNLVANTSNFKSAMKESSDQIRLLNSEFKNASAETDNYGNRMDSTGAKQKQLSGLVDQHKNRIVAIKNEQRHWTNELKKGNITEEQHAQKQKELASRLNNTEAQMKKYEGQLKRLNAEGKSARMTYEQFDQQFREVGRTMRNVGAAVGIAAGVGFTAMKRVLGDVVNESMEFEAGMSEVKAISGATGSEMEKLTKQAKDLGRQTKFAAQEAAESQANLARAGFNTNEIYSAMPGLLDLAASSNMELGNAADITANILRGFGKDAEESGKVADVLAKGAATANTDVEGLGKAMEYVAPVAKSLDVEFESAAAAVGMLADAGIDGSKAGRQLRQGMLKLSKPTGEAGELIEELGINAFDADGNMKSLDGVVAELEKGLKGQSKQAKAAALSTLFGSESTAGWNVLLDQGSDTLKEYTGELEDSDSAAKEMADTMMDNAEGAMVKMQSALSGLKIELGEKLLPVLSDAADWVSDLANNFTEMDDATAETIAQSALLVTGILGVTTVVGGLTAAVGALMAFAGPIGLAITGGTAALGLLTGAIYKNKVETKNLADEQKQAEADARKYGEGLSEGTKEGVKGYVDLYEGAKIKMLELKNMTGKEAEETSDKVVKAFSEMTDNVVSELEGQKNEMANAINEVLSVAGETGEKKAGEMSKEVIAQYDKEIAEYIGAMETVQEAHDKYNGKISEMPAKFKKEYRDALSVVSEGSKEFAQTQEEMLAIQDNISERQGSIMFEDAQDYYNQVTDTYQKSIKNANEFYAEKTDIFDRELAKGKISTEDYNLLMQGVETKTSKMLQDASKSQEESLKILSENIDSRGKLIDISTGEEFKRMQKRDEYNRLQTESDAEYLGRWLDSTKETLDSHGDFSEEALRVQKENLEAMLIEMGHTEEEAREIAAELIDGMVEEVNKGDEEFEEAGKNKGEASNRGLESTKDMNKQTADDITDSQIKSFLKGESESYEGGKSKGSAHSRGMNSTKQENIDTATGLTTNSLDKLREGAKDANASGGGKGTAHSVGMRSTEKDNINTATGITTNSLNKLREGAQDANKSGSSKGTSHSKGVSSTAGANSSAGSMISNTVSNLLGSTTDGGGGSRAGSMFATGVRNRSGAASGAGTTVASSGERGLRSVSTSGAGTSFVSGFRGAISRGSVFGTAAALGRRALSGLKSAIKSQSPSKETGQEGTNFTDGFVNSINDNVRDSERSAEMFGRKSLDALSDEVNRYKQDFAALSFGLEQNKQSLVVEHSLDNRFNEMIQAVNSANNKDDPLLKAVLEQNKHMSESNKILMKLLRKDDDTTLDGKSIEKNLDHRLATGLR